MDNRFLVRDFVAGTATIMGDKAVWKRHNMTLFIGIHNALSIPQEDLQALEGRKDVKKVLIYDMDYKVKYIASLSAFRKSGDVRFVSERAGYQVFLPIEQFTIEERHYE